MVFKKTKLYIKRNNNVRKLRTTPIVYEFVKINIKQNINFSFKAFEVHPLAI